MRHGKVYIPCIYIVRASQNLFSNVHVI